MEFEEATSLVLRLLEEKGKAKNSEMMKLCGNDRELFDRVREDLIFNDLAEDKKGVGLVYVRPPSEVPPLEVPVAEDVQEVVASEPNIPDADVVISYSHKDFDLAREIVRQLENASVKLWWDKTGIRAGRWREKIVRAIRSSKTLTVLCSINSMQSEDVRTELELADYYRRNRLPLGLDETDYPESIIYCLVSWHKHRVPIMDRSVTEWLPEVLDALVALGVACDRPALPPPAVAPAPTAAKAVKPSWPERRAVPVTAPPVGRPGAGRRFRIFVSSTYGDMKEERNALQRFVFPRLRELCSVHGCRFEAVDLRWGVSQEAGLDQQAMPIALQEIDPCRRTTSRPNFIVLLGDRYGWRPLPSEIPAHEFEEICRRISADKQQRLKDWYFRDDNAVPPDYCLKPREMGGEYEDFAIWEAVERDLRSILLAAVKGMPLEAHDRMKYEASATEQEIAQGALRVPDAREHVYCFFRTIKDLPRDLSGRDFVDLDSEGNPDIDARRRLEELKHKLRGLLPDNIYDYEARWNDGGITTDHIDKLCEDVFDALSRIIEQEIERLEQVDPLDKEIADHDDFGQDRAKFFTGRADMLRKIGDYVKSGDSQPLAVWGESGSGKSALMARAAQQVREDLPNAEVVLRFLDATPESSDGRALLDSLCRQISRAYGADEATVPTDYREVVDDFPKRLALATEEKPLILFLDALDQLSDAEGARSLIWLPADLPEHVRLIVSTLPGECLSALESKLSDTSLVELKPMPPDEGRKLLDLWLEDAGRTLPQHQRDEVLSKFGAEGRPLYLKLAFEEARRWKSYTDPSDTVLAEGIRGIIRENLFARLSSPANHGKMIVSRSLGYLVAAKNGLSEDELLDVLSSDADVLSDFKRRSPISPEVERLPVVLWSRLYFDLEPYLTERSADGASLMTFYHRQLGEVVAEDYLAGDAKPGRHRALADYFDKQGLEIEGAPNLRKMSELPFQQTHGEMWEELFATLTNFPFLERKAADLGVLERTDAEGNVTRTHTGVFLLQDDFRLALEKMPGDGATPGGRRPLLEVFSRALGRESHVLHRRPDLLWQQLYNRLQWSEGGPERLAAELQRRTRPGSAPWMRVRTPSRESEALIRTLEGHSGPVRSCVLSRDGSVVVSAGDDYTVRLWDATTGAERACLVGHDDWVTGCAISRDGSFVVSASSDLTLRVWDAVRGVERAVLGGHTAAVTACAISPDGSFIVSGSRDGTLKLWDVATGKELRTLEGHTSGVRSCAISPDGAFIVSASEDGSLRIWDAAGGRVLCTLKGHTDAVLGCAVSPDEAFIVSASRDGTLKLWDPSSGRELRSLEGHGEPVRGCAISGEGSFIVSAGDDRVLRIWDSATGIQRATLVGHADLVTACAVSSDGSFVVSASDDGTLKVWDMTLLQEPAAIEGHDGAISGCAISADGALVASASQDGTIKVWDLATGVERATLGGHMGGVFSCTFSPDGSALVSASDDGTLKVYDPETGEERATLRGHRGGVFGCAVSPDGAFVVSAGEDRTLKLWDIGTGMERATLEGHVSSVNRCAVSPDGSFVVSASDDETVRIWDAVTGQQRARLVGHGSSVWGCAVSPDAAFVVSASWDGTVRIWDVKSGEQRTVLNGHTDQVWDCSVTPDGGFIVSASRDKTLRVWDTFGRECASLPLPGGALSVALHPHLPFAACGDESGSFYLVDLVGIEYGPIIVTTSHGGTGPTLRCPACHGIFPLEQSWLGAEMTCPNRECGTPLRVNPFIAGLQR